MHYATILNNRLLPHLVALVMIPLSIISRKGSQSAVQTHSTVRVLSSVLRRKNAPRWAPPTTATPTTAIDHDIPDAIQYCTIETFRELRAKKLYYPS